MNLQTENPLIGFYPDFWSIGETIPQVKIAKEYMNMGGRGIFFSHGGKYEYLAKDIGCEVIELPSVWIGFVDKAKKMLEKKVPYEKIMCKVYRKEIIDVLIESEIEAFKKNRVNLVVSSFTPTSAVSARVLNLPLVVLYSGTVIPPFYESGLASFPENFENVFTRLLPSSVKNRIYQWYFLHNKMFVRDFNRVAKKYDLPPFKYFNEIVLGNHTLVCDDINFLGLTPTEEFPVENFVGPIAGDFLKTQDTNIDTEIINHLKRNGKSILLIMGSFFDKNLFLKILETLNRTDYNVIAVYTTILKKEELPKTNENVLLTRFIKSPLQVQKMVDLAIIHGGRGTSYIAAYSGKPVIGIPMIMEHQYNIDNMVRNGAALRISKKYFQPQKLLNAIETIFGNYETFLSNAQHLASKLPPLCGEKKAVKRLVEIIQSYTKK